MKKQIYLYFKPYRLKAAIAIMFKFFEAALELYMPMLLSQVIDKGIANGDKSYTTRMCLILIAIIAAGLGCALVCQYLASKISQQYGTQLRNGLFRHILSLSQSQKEVLTTPSMINRIITDATRVQVFVAMVIRLILRAPFLCIGGIAMSFVINKQLAWIIVAALPIFTVVTFIIMKKSIPLHNKAQKHLDSVATVLDENIEGSRVIRAFATDDFESKRFQGATNEYTALNLRVKKLSSLLNPLTSAIVNMAIIAILLWSGRIYSTTRSVTTGDIMALINYVAQISVALVVVANLVVLLIRAYSSAQRINEVFAQSPDITFGNKSQDRLTTDTAVEFKDVCFAYPNGKNVLEDINFSIEKGSYVGIIGGTGSGKSTLVSLITRLYDPKDGKILLDGEDIRTYTDASIKSMISIVPQKIQILSGSINDAISFGRQIDEDNIAQAAKNACADGFIEHKSNGYNSRVEKNAANFSGGQRQRLAIARAMAYDSDILIFDDSSSALDSITDAKIRDNIKTNFPNKTVIAVSQRVAAIRDADKILVVHNGRICGDGKHNELYASSDIYREICQSQEVSDA